MEGKVREDQVYSPISTDLWADWLRTALYYTHCSHLPEEQGTTGRSTFTKHTCVHVCTYLSKREKVTKSVVIFRAKLADTQLNF